MITTAAGGLAEVDTLEEDKAVDDAGEDENFDAVSKKPWKKRRMWTSSSSLSRVWTENLGMLLAKDDQRSTFLMENYHLCPHHLRRHIYYHYHLRHCQYYCDCWLLEKLKLLHHLLLMFHLHMNLMLVRISLMALMRWD